MFPFSYPVKYLIKADEFSDAVLQSV